VNSAIEDLTVGKLGVVVIDELHIINDDSRGYILELMATKLLSLEQNIQLVGMSATLNVSLARSALILISKLKAHRTPKS
jgi:replicative superfamily II helicase